MSLTVTVLGSSGTYAGPGGACSGYLVRTGDTAVLMDAGPGVLGNLQRHVPVTGLDGVVVSHSHPDHWLELPILRNALKYVHRAGGLDVFATAETLELLERLAGTTLSRTLRPNVVTDGDEVKIGSQRYRFSRTDHPPETLGIRVDGEGGSIGYTADTAAGWSLAELGADLDLGLSEATFLHEEMAGEPVHLSARQAGALARAAGVGRLVITHVLPTGSTDAAVAEAADAYGAPVEVAEVHRTFRL